MPFIQTAIYWIERYNDQRPIRREVGHGRNLIARDYTKWGTWKGFAKIIVLVIPMVSMACYSRNLPKIVLSVLFINTLLIGWIAYLRCLSSPHFMEIIEARARYRYLSPGSISEEIFSDLFTFSVIAALLVTAAMSFLILWATIIGGELLRKMYWLIAWMLYPPQNNISQAEVVRMISSSNNQDPL
jgi:hypothetical protein